MENGLVILLTPLVQTAVTSPELQAWTLPLDDLIRGTIQAATEIWLTSVFWQAGLMMMAGVVLMVLGFLAGMWRAE